MTYWVVGTEPYHIAEVFSVHSNKKIAESQATTLNQTKSPLCCQWYGRKESTGW